MRNQTTANKITDKCVISYNLIFPLLDSGCGGRF
jgi:hypothetical protein